MKLRVVAVGAVAAMLGLASIDASVPVAEAIEAVEAVDQEIGASAPAAQSPVASSAGPSASSTQLEPVAFRHDLSAFMADVYQVAPPSYQPAAPTRPTLAELQTGIASLSAAELGSLEQILGPLVQSWKTVDALAADLEGEPHSPATMDAMDEESLEQLREDLDTFFERQEPLAARVGDVDEVFADRMTESRQWVQALTLDDLAKMQASLELAPSVRQLLDYDAGQLLGPLPGEGGTGMFTAGGEIPATHIHPECADMSFGPKVTGVLTAVSNYADGVAGGLSNDFIVAALFGGNVPNIAKLILLGVWVPLAIVAIAAQTDTDVFLNCNEGYHQTVFEAHDKAMVVRTNLIVGTLTSHDDYLDSRLDRVDTFHDEYRELVLRLAIEEDLLRKGDDRIALFQVPQSTCITVGEHSQCGALETARDIVADTIRMNREAGLDVAQAQIAYDDGETQRMLGNYKEAYTRYRHAYVRAVRSQAR